MRKGEKKVFLVGEGAGILTEYSEVACFKSPHLVVMFPNGTQVRLSPRESHDLYEGMKEYYEK